MPPVPWSVGAWSHRVVTMLILTQEYEHRVAACLGGDLLVW